MTVILNASLLCTHLLQRMIRDLIKIFLNLIFYVINKICSVINLRGFFLYGQLFAWFDSAHQTKTRLSNVPLSTAAPLLRNCFAAFPILVAYNAKSIFAKKKTSENQKSFCELHWIRTSDPRLKSVG